ncbi:hypothetical protein [Sunxiuqinia indica]|uniref:hypothetical protein n=1 Tax=Sunxiuqinia indica TaxID=2692584 RepID=UPI001358069F|nr:hypothetical protein [Sunxiuqinia indica]
MKRLFIILLLALVGKSNLLYSQLSPGTLYRFPTHILLRIEETAQKTALCEDSQIRLGNYFIKKDSLAREALSQGTPWAEVAEQYKATDEGLLRILSPLEYNEYRLTTRGISGCSRLRDIVRLQGSVGLSEDQVAELLRQSVWLEKRNDEKGFDLSLQDFRVTDSLLTREQHMTYYRLKNEAEATRAAQRHLLELENDGFCSTSTDSARYYPAILGYELNTRIRLAYLKDSGNKIKYEQEKASLEGQEPVILQQLRVYKSMPWWSVSKDAINQRKEMNLRRTQVDSLISGFEACLQQEEAYKQSRSNTRFDRKIAEYKQLIATLSPAQFNHYLRLQRQDQATENAGRQWENLLKYKLVEQKDHNQVINELYAYELKLLVATEWVYIDNSRKHVFARQDISDNKPELLKQLDAARKKEAESKIVRF